MILSLFRKDPRAATIRTIYGAIVAQSREPAFYLEGGVPDTFEGRFEMVALHVFLFLYRLKGAGEAARETGQAVFDLMVKSFEDALREKGIGDLGVPKRMKALVQGFYGRTRAYDEALQSGDRQALEAALARNVFGGARDAAAMAGYVLENVAALAAMPTGDLVAGGPRFAAFRPSVGEELR